jgi:hypothetical protein
MTKPKTKNSIQAADMGPRSGRAPHPWFITGLEVKSLASVLRIHRAATLVREFNGENT